MANEETANVDSKAFEGGHYPSDCCGAYCAEGPNGAATKAQAFFATLAAESRRPSFGEMQSGWTRNLLLRAQEAGLFDPTLENA
jgi:hypothetical protein